MHFNGNRGPQNNQGVSCAPTLSLADVAHESAHWIVAAPFRRELVNYGLGAGPERHKEGDVRLDHEDYRPSVDGIEEELQASLLGILMETKVGEDPTSTLKEHDYPSNSDDLPVTFLKIKKKVSFRGIDSCLKKVRAALAKLKKEDD